MSDIEDHEKRLTAALERISSGLDKLDADGSGEAAALKTELDEEKLANAQLQERLKTLTARQAAADEAAADKATQLDLELQRLRQANSELRASNTALREANAKGVGEPHLINKAMLAELEALRAARAAEIAEAESIIGALTPLLDEAGAVKEEDETDA
ncbi:MAG: hypothetical protein AAGK82_11780 [Pseudomonadota bacterium]